MSNNVNFFSQISENKIKLALLKCEEFAKIRIQNIVSTLTFS